ncbi:hypothetical protein PAT3040_04169 [Paenibacillus agaridevorans]|uniref:Uncharacterized protein n=1 Tax=Paenibacillus agaridevorans TaxID=171404 RepID=A0A2R5EV27_9BACL|nr:hypothetical protein [Paenibacillus agaridevorans]GBG09519.1 hypothetical protein PAT3040_04169 [Paenibacillus agaridevorans]
MFNRSAFNQVRFNQSHDHKTMSAELGAKAELSATVQATLSAVAHLSAESSLRQLTYLSANLSASAGITAKPGLVVWSRAALSAEGEVAARASKWQRRELIFTGAWLPGQVILINHRALTLLLDGQNALPLMQGQFGDFASGLNELVYSDATGLRTVLCQIMFQQKQL